MRGYKNTRVLLLTHSFVRWEGDFAGVFLLDLTRGLAEEGIQVCIIAPHEGELPLYEKIVGIDIYRFRYALSKFERLAYQGNMHELVMKNLINKFIFATYMGSFFIKALIVARKEKIDIIHAHWWVPSGLIALLVSKLLRKPYIVTSHGSDVFILDRFAFLKPFARLVFNEANSITVVSNNIKSFLISKFGILDSKINVFPMPCDLSLFYPISEDKDPDKTEFRMLNNLCSYNNYENKVLSIGRLIELKGYNYLIEAMRILKEKNLNVKLIIIGEGPEEKTLRSKAQSFGLSNEIEFLHFKPKGDLNYFYNLCDVFVLPSITDSIGRQEGLGLVLLEAMNCKKPVVGTNSGGIPDVVKDGETGLLVPEKDPEALANAIEKLLRDKKLATKLAENGYNYVLDNFSISKIANKVMQIYLNVLRGLK